MCMWQDPQHAIKNIIKTEQNIKYGVLITYEKGCVKQTTFTYLFTYLFIYLFIYSFILSFIYILGNFQLGHNKQKQTKSYM